MYILFRREIFWLFVCIVKLFLVFKSKFVYYDMFIFNNVLKEKNERYMYSIIYNIFVLYLLLL